MVTDSALSRLSRYVYGTTRLGDESIPVEARVAIAREAIDSGLSIHTSHQYGEALNVLRMALDQNRTVVPKTIFKIGWSSVEEVRGQIVEQLAVLDLSGMTIGQLCPGGPLAEELAAGGTAVAGLEAIKADGLVRDYVMEVWPWTSETAIKIVKNGPASGLIKGLIFYLNPLQRFVSNELWDLIQESQIPIVAMRTVSGGNVLHLRDSGRAPEYLQQRAQQVAPIFERSGVESWTEFCVRFALGFDLVRATVGSTSRRANLQEFLHASANPVALDPDAVAEIVALQRQWSVDHDQFAAPWSM